MIKLPIDRMWRAAEPVSARIHAAFALIGRTCPSSGINLRRASHRFVSANSVCSCAVFLASPR
jgi:hypothetical protein